MMPTPRQFKMIAAAALAGFDAVMDWLGLSGGKNAGREYQPLNPKRDDHTPGSLSIHRDKGTWADFATGDKGGDLISLAAYLWDCRNGEAAERLGKHLGILQDGRESAGKGADGSVPPVSEKPANAPGKPRDGVCVLPVPADAPPVPVAHPTHGKAAARWDYVDARGATMFYHCRFEPVDKRKQFASLTLWRLPDGGLAWKWKVPPDPRPLLGLDRLTACPQAVVVIVEGEKAGDAAALLLPDAVVMTWQGGANAVDKADWTPLSGRRVWLWPDADLPGRKAMRRAAMRLRAVGAADVRWIDLNALAKTASVREGRAELIAGAPLAEGDDAADLAMRGWTAAHLAGLIESGSLLTEVDGEIPDEAAGEKAAPLSRKRGFRLDDQGVWFVDVNRDGEECTPRWISAPLDILARVRDPQNCGWGLWVGFDDPDGRPHKEIIPARSFNGEGLEATGLLLDRGLTIAPRGRPLLLEYLQTANPKQRARVTARTGWHEADERRVFVLPEIAFGQGEQAWIFESESPAGNFRQKGTLAEWKEGVACLCTGNSRLAFAVSMTFAAPLLYLAGEESGGFHLCGAASNGKTSALRVAASVCGGPDYMQRWRSTDNGLEVLAVQHCDSLLLLDELAQIDPKVAGESAYLLANGSGKARAGRNGGLRARLDWRLLFLSTGEIGLATHMMEVGKQTRAGQELRLAEIPADAGAGCGLFEALHDSKDGAAFARTLDQATRRAYGSAWMAFLKRLVLEEDAGEIANELRVAQKRFGGRYLSEQAGGQAQRLANRFALVGAAGELATSWGLTDWPAGEAMQAAGVCFAAWLANRGGEGNQEERAMLGKVREFLRRYGESAFTDTGRSNITDDHAPVRSDRAGWRECSDNETHYFISNEAFHARVCTGFDFRAVGRLLLARGFAEAGTEKDRPWLTRKAIPGEGRARVVHVLPAIFEDANEKND